MSCSWITNAFRLLLTWLMVWPLVMAGLVAVEHVAPGLPFVLRTLLLTGLLVPLMALVVAPLAGRIADRPKWAKQEIHGGRIP